MGLADLVLTSVDAALDEQLDERSEDGDESDKNTAVAETRPAAAEERGWAPYPQIEDLLAPYFSDSEASEEDVEHSEHSTERGEGIEDNMTPQKAGL